MDYTILSYSRAAITSAQAERALEAAIPSLEKLHLDPSRYKSGVDVLDNDYRVGFADKNSKSGTSLGNPGKIPAIQVRVDPRTFKIISVGTMR